MGENRSSILLKIRRLTKLHGLKRGEYLARCFAIFFPFSFSQLPPGLVSGAHLATGLAQQAVWGLDKPRVCAMTLVSATALHIRGELLPGHLPLTWKSYRYLWHLWLHLLRSVLDAQ